MADPALVLPGLMADARVFDRMIRSLCLDRPVQIDLPIEAASVPTLARNLLNTAPPRFLPIGHGLGGFVAIEAARLAPERVPAMVLISTCAQSEVPARAAEMDTHLVRAQAGAMGAAIAELTGVSRMRKDDLRIEIESLQARMALDLGPEVMERQIRAIQRRPDQQATLRRLKMPVLIIAGEVDPIYSPARAEFMAGLLPNARLEILRGAGHMLPLEMPARLAELVSAFLPKPLILR